VAKQLKNRGIKNPDSPDSGDWKFTARFRPDWVGPVSLEALLSDQDYLRFTLRQHGVRDVARFIIQNTSGTRDEKFERIAKLFGMEPGSVKAEVNRSSKFVYKRKRKHPR